MSDILKNPKAICILGMHRSGTSTITRAINLLGAHLGEEKDLMSPAPDNPEGFWERYDIKELHDNILHTFKRTWDTTITLPDQWHSSLEILPHREELKRLISDNFSIHELWAWKDPRTCLLLPLWKDVLEELGVELSCVFVVRHPVDVANSLSKRNNFPIGKSFGIWFNHNIIALQALINVPTAFVSYDKLLDGWKPELLRCSNILGITCPTNDVNLDKSMHSFIRPNLRHSISTVTDLHHAPSPVQELYNSLLNKCGCTALDNSKPLENSIFRLAREFQAYTSFIQADLDAKYELRQTLEEARCNRDEFERKLVELDSRLKERNTLLTQATKETERLANQHKEQLAHKEEHLKSKDAQIAELYRSFSWRLTKPLRKLYELLQRSRMADILRHTCSTIETNTADVKSTARVPITVSILRDTLVREALAARNDSFDVFVFPVIDWHFRIQRPQQLAKKLAAGGHRLFYLTTRFTDDHQEPAFQITESPERNVFLVTLQCPIPHPQIYRDTLSGNQLHFVAESLLLLHRVCEIRQSVSLVDLPFWRPLAKALPGSLLIYDCMDHHGGFSTNTNTMLLEEKKLLHQADLVITSSQRLSEIIAEDVPNTVIRNGADVSFFARRPEKLAFNTQKPVVGYFGAISEWFDIDLVIAAAIAYPGWEFVLVGSTFGCNVTKAEKASNIRFLGEVPYSTLPSYLYTFDVCIIPFNITELTLCTNPVKVYEYLSAGKPVVATSMPELRLIEHQLHIADSKEQFVARLNIAMQESSDKELADQRIAWVRQHDWQMRAAELDRHILAHYPKASIIVLTYNNIHLTKDCLDSLNRFTGYPNWELIIVDNASSDGTPAYLKEFQSQHNNVRVILNATNLGFAAGNNIGVKEATGEFLVLLNNDTVVTQGWLFDLIRHLRKDDSLGLLGPVTNSIGNEAQIEISYTSMEDMHIKARKYTSTHARKLMSTKTVAFFCVALRRTVWEQVGPLDEAFSVGFFEDDDYCRRIHAEGYTAAIAEDVFVQHQHSASFSILSPQQRNEIFERNKKVYEKKWGTWVPHEYRR